MLRALAIAVVIIVALAGMTLAAKKATTPTTISGEVVSIDTATGALTVKDSMGKEHKVKPTDPKELDQLTVGDKVTVETADGKTSVKKQEVSTPAP
jgi:hypothetical protein